MGKCLRCWVVAFVVVCCGWGETSAQNRQAPKAPPPLPEPALVVRFPSYEGLLDDIDYLGRLAGNPEASQQVEALLALVTAGQGLQGLDRDRAGGMVVLFRGFQVEQMVFLPCSDAEKLVKLLELFAEELRPLEPENDDSPRFYHCRLNEQRFYLRADPKWLWLARRKEVLERVPASPEPWLKSLQAYDLALELRYQQLPLMVRLGLKTGMLVGVFQRLTEENEKLTQEKIDQAREELEFFFKVVDSLDRLALGATLDAKKRAWQLELAIDLVPESYWAKWSGMFRKGHTRHQGFISPKAAANFAFTTLLDAQARQFLVKEILELDTPERIRQQAGALAESDPDSPEYQQEVQWTEKLLKLMREITLDGTLDVCGALEVEQQQSWFLLGVTLPEKQEVQQLVQQFLEPLAQFRTEVIGQSKWKLARFAVEDEDLEELLGSDLEGAVALGPRAVYLVFGPEAEKRLRRRLASPRLGKPALVDHVLQAQLNLAQLIRMAHQMEPDEETEELLKLLPEDASPLISFSGEYAPGKERYRLELNEAALRLLIDLFRWGFRQAVEEELMPEF